MNSLLKSCVFTKNKEFFVNFRCLVQDGPLFDVGPLFDEVHYFNLKVVCNIKIIPSSISFTICLGSKKKIPVNVFDCRGSVLCPGWSTKWLPRHRGNVFSCFFTLHSKSST